MNDLDKDMDLDGMKKLAEEGYGPAADRVGNYYYYRNNYQEAAKWFEKGAVLNDIECQYSLGQIYVERGPLENESTALLWFNKAAEQGHSISQYKAAILISKGRGDFKNNADRTKEAARLMRLAADQLHPAAVESVAIYERTAFHAERSVFRFGRLTSLQVNNRTGDITYTDWHLPMTCAHQAVYWLGKRLGRDVTHMDLRRTLGLFIPKNRTLIAILAEWGFSPLVANPMDAASSFEEIAMLAIVPGQSSLLTHTVAIELKDGVWSVFDPGNLRSQLIHDVNRESIRDLLDKAIVIMRKPLLVFDRTSSRRKTHSTGETQDQLVTSSKEVSILRLNSSDKQHYLSQIKTS